MLKGKAMRSHLPYLFLALGVLALLFALASGLVRFGWNLPLHDQSLVLVHGGLMICGVLGTFISLERAITLGHPWAYIAPLLTAIGGIWLLAIPTAPWPPFLMALGSALLLFLFALSMRRAPAPSIATMGLGALFWLVGNALWVANFPIVAVVPWWLGFLLLIVAGHRLEQLFYMSRGAYLSFFACVGFLLLGALLDTVSFAAQWGPGGPEMDLFIGDRLIGLAMLGVALWLLFYDIAPAQTGETSLPRYIAFCLVSGYAWLAIAGTTVLLTGQLLTGPLYDAVLHAFFTGFVAVALFAYALHILAQVLDRKIPFDRIFYLALLLLHLGLFLRVGGDLSGARPGQQWGGMLNAVAILIFLAGIVRASRRSSLEIETTAS
jgi:hypothetical protein